MKSLINILGISFVDGHRCGNPGYLAPEILSLSGTYKGKIDPKCDVFSVGCIFYELMHGG